MIMAMTMFCWTILVGGREGWGGGEDGGGVEGSWRRGGCGGLVSVVVRGGGVGFASAKVGLVVDRRADRWVDVTSWKA